MPVTEDIRHLNPSATLKSTPTPHTAFISSQLKRTARRLRRSCESAPPTAGGWEACQSAPPRHCSRDIGTAPAAAACPWCGSAAAPAPPSGRDGPCTAGGNARTNTDACRGRSRRWPGRARRNTHSTGRLAEAEWWVGQGQGQGEGVEEPTSCWMGAAATTAGRSSGRAVVSWLASRAASAASSDTYRPGPRKTHPLAADGIESVSCWYSCWCSFHAWNHSAKVFLSRDRQPKRV